MQTSIKNRLARLEALHRPPEETWTIGFDLCEWDGFSIRPGRVLAHIPPRRIEPGQPFDMQQCIAELARAHDEAYAAMENDYADLP